MVSGRKRDPKRIAEMARLRALGLTLAEIGRRLGVSRQRVHETLANRLRPPPPRCVPCAGCGAPIASPGVLPSDAGRALCLCCLASRLDAPFGVRLKSLRLATGLMKAELARRAGAALHQLGRYEDGRRVPRRRVQERLAHVLGLALLRVGEAAAFTGPAGSVLR
jgi:transcriptional regulator with XRE-family HTH domain